MRELFDRFTIQKSQYFRMCTSKILFVIQQSKCDVLKQVAMNGVILRPMKQHLSSFAKVRSIFPYGQVFLGVPFKRTFPTRERLYC